MKPAPFPVRAVLAASRSEFADAADADLLRRFAAKREGDAFAELVRRYGPLVWRVARTTAGSAADDVFQATFLTLSKNAAAVRNPAALAGWLHRTAHRAAVRARRTEAKRSLPPARSEPSTTADPLDSLTARELLVAVDEELAALPDALRAAVVLCGVEGLSQDEAAKRLGWSPGSVKGRLERGRAKLLARLDARGLTLPVLLGGLTLVPAELTAAMLAVVGGEPAAPAVVKLVAEVSGMNWSHWMKPTAALMVVAAGLTIAASGGADPGPAPGSQVVPVRPVANADAKADGLIRWSSPLRTDLDDPALPSGTAGIWTPDGKHVLVSGSAQPAKDKSRVGEVRVHDASTGKVVHTFRGTAMSYDNRAGHLAISRDGKMVAAGARTWDENNRYENFVEVWDWGQEKPRLKLGAEKPLTEEQLRQDPLGLKPRFPDHLPTPVTGLAFSPFDKALYATCMSGLVKSWELNSGLRLFESNVSQGRIWGLAVVPGGKRVAVPDGSGNVVFLDTVGATRGKIKDLGGEFLSVAISPNGKTLAVGGLTGADRVAVAIADLVVPEEGDVRGEKVRHGPKDFTDIGAVYQVAFSPDGKLLAVACQDKVLRVLDPADGKLIALAKEHADFVYSVQFSPDGKSLLTVGRDSVKMWSVAELLGRTPKPVDPAVLKEAASKRDLKRLVGEWNVRAAMIDGRVVPADELPNLDDVVYTAEGWEKRSEGKVVAAGKVSAMDATAEPRTIDYEITSGADKGKVVKAVYEIMSWDRYRVCYAEPGAERPKDFECKPGSGHTRMAFLRVIPAKD